MATQYSDEALLEMIQVCKDEHGVATPRIFNSMEDTCAATTVMRRFGSWEDAKERAGITEDLSNRTGRDKKYTDGDVLRHIRECADRHDGKATVELLNNESDLIAPSVAVERFGSWSNAKEEAGVKADNRADNHRPQKYSDEDYYELLRECKEKHGSVTQRVFDDDDSFPSSGAVSQRFGGWDKAKKLAGLNVQSGKYSDEELLKQLIDCKEKYDSCSASNFAADDEFASPETVQRRFGSWSEAKEKATDFEATV
jgi:hypothetical protein